MTGSPVVAADRVSGWLARIAVARAALVDLTGEFATMRGTADPATGERWTGGQIAAHIAELLPYWLDEVDKIMSVEAAGGDAGRPVVGRTKAAPERLAAVARALDRPVDVLVADMFAQIDAAAARVRAVPVAALEREGDHVVRGVITAARLIEVFVVEHLEEHLDQAREAVQHRPVA